MIQGKPAFEATPLENDGTNRGDIPSATQTTPEIFVGHCKYSLSGEHLDVYASITNNTAVPVFLDKLFLVNIMRELDYSLEPGQSRELKVYEGPVPRSGVYTEARLYYRDARSGTYYQARHHVEYHFDNGRYFVEELHPVRPVIKD